MTRRLRLAAVATAGAVLGAVLMLALQQPSATPADRPTSSRTTTMQSRAASPGLLPLDVPTREPPTDVSSGTDRSSAAPTSEPDFVPKPPQRLLLAWTPGGLPDGFAEGIASLESVETVTAVRGDLLELTASWDAGGQPVDETREGFVIPLDAIAVDPATYPAVLPASAGSAVKKLQPGEVLLGVTSSRIRGLGEGAVLELSNGHRLTVAGVVEDTLIGGAEIAMVTDAADAAGITTPRYVLVTYAGERADMEQSVRDVPIGDVAMRVRGPGETPYFRHGDAVLPQVFIKERFGEFSYRPGGGRAIEQEPGWADEHIVATDVRFSVGSAATGRWCPRWRGRSRSSCSATSPAWLTRRATPAATTRASSVRVSPPSPDTPGVSRSTSTRLAIPKARAHRRIPGSWR